MRQMIIMASITRNNYNVPRRMTDEDGNPANNPNYVADKRGTKEVKHLGNFLKQSKYTSSQL